MRTLGVSHARRGRAGASLPELLVALVLFGIVSGATLRALDRQARFHAGVMAILEARGQHAAAHEALAVSLRGLSAAGGDIGRLTDSAIVFRLQVGSGIACGISSGALDLAPDSIANGQRLGSFAGWPQPGDSAWILDEGPTDAAADDAWAALRVTSVSSAAGRCPGSPLLDPVRDAARPAWRLSVSGSPPASAVAGAPVRLTRVARFALYRGGTGESWLGYSERQPATGWITIQPVSGPYLPFNRSAPPASGLALLGRDSSGIVVAGPGPVAPAVLSIATRTLTTRAVRMDGIPRGARADSLHSLIGLRNVR
jgi:hypothetical protein